MVFFTLEEKIEYFFVKIIDDDIFRLFPSNNCLLYACNPLLNIYLRILLLIFPGLVK